MHELINERISLIDTIHVIAQAEAVEAAMQTDDVAEEEKETKKELTKKKRKAADVAASPGAAVTSVEPVAAFSCGSGAVMDLCFPFDAATVVASTSDFKLRAVDLLSTQCVASWTLPNAAVSLDGRQGSVLCAYADGKVHLWDCRDPQQPAAAAPPPSETSALTLSQGYSLHARCCSRVRWHPLDPNLFASVGHDAHLRIYDRRSLQLSVQSICLEEKLLGLAWAGPGDVVIGGSSGGVTNVKINV
eukprot:GHVU01192798.1.p2 GENE.GHVU01192798.1~~GHVU01192798.1.p2  ORF type:complete len:246 (-),score=45.59 GHVU01192798.1:256-993(-)